MLNNQEKFKDQLNYLKYQSKFSLDEIIPVLEQKISSMQKEEYMVDFFITGNSDLGLLDVQYLAFPKQDSYVKALFAHKGNIYKYTKKDEKHGSLKQINSSALNYSHINFKNILEIKENEKIFLIGQEQIPVQEVLSYLVASHKEDLYLCNGFFCYDQKMDELSDTITEFAKTKTPQK